MTTEYVCEECDTVHTSASALMYCCADVDRHGRPKRGRGDDWLD